MQQRELINYAANFWKCFEFFFAQYDTVALRPRWLLVSFLIVLVNACLTLPFLWRRPNSRTFGTCFTLTFMGMYMFGYYMHEKHFQYAHLGIVLNLIVYKDFATTLSAVAALSNFFMAAWNANAPVHVLILVFSILHGLACEKALDSFPEDGPEFRACSPFAEKLARFANWQRGWRSSVTKFAVVYMIPFYLLNLYCEIVPACPWLTGAFRSVWVFSGPFLWLCFLYVYMWIVMYFESGEDCELIVAHCDRKERHVA